MIIIGHRGARGLAPENTIASIQAGLDQAVNGIEIDIRLTQDGVVILHHGPTLAASPTVTIASQTYAEILQLKPDITTLATAIQAINRQVPLYIEVKPGEPTAPVIAIVERFLRDGWQPSDFFFVSFECTALAALQKALPAIPRIINENWSSIRVRNRARRLDTHYIALNRRALWWGYIRLMRYSQYHLLCFTVNNPKTAQRWGQAGLYGIYTDFPDRFRNEL